MWVGRYVYLGAGVCRGQKRVSDTLELLLQAAVSYLECVLGTESEPSAGARSLQIHEKRVTMSWESNRQNRPDLMWDRMSDRNSLRMHSWLCRFQSTTGLGSGRGPSSHEGTRARVTGSRLRKANLRAVVLQPGPLPTFPPKPEPPQF